MTRLYSFDLYVLFCANRRPYTSLLLAYDVACLSGGAVYGWKRLLGRAIIFFETLQSIERLLKSGMLKEEIDLLALHAMGGSSSIDTGPPPVPKILTITPAGAQRLAA